MGGLMSALAPPKDAEAIKESDEKQKEEARNEPVSLNDIFGMMGGLMSALAPSEDAKAGSDEMSTVLGSNVDGAAKDVVQNSHEILTKVGKPAYEWVPLDSKKVPENALLAAKDHGNAVYVGRGLLDGSIRLGKYHAKYETLYVSHLGEEKEVYENIEVLCVGKDAKVEWVDCKKGILPAGSIVGAIVDGKSEYVGKGKTGSEITPGRIVPEDKCMYAPYGGKDHMLTESQALVIQNKVLVIKPKAKEALMEKQVNEAREAENNDEKARTMRDILDDIETIEATIELEEEKFNREIVHKKEVQGKEMEKLKKKLKIKRKELKDGLSLK